MAKTTKEPILTEGFINKVQRLAKYIQRAASRNAPAILFVLFKVESTRKLAEQSLTGILEGKDFRIISLDLRDDSVADVVHRLLEQQTSAKDVFYLRHLREGASSALGSLNVRRELLVDHAVKLVIWLEESELLWLTQGAPDFWAFRQRVVEFLELPEEEPFQQAVQRLYQGTESASSEERMAKIKLRKDLLESLPAESSFERARLSFELGQLLYDQGDLQHASNQFQRALSLCQESRDKANIAVTLHQLGMIAQDQGDYDEARKLYGQVSKIFEKLGDQGGIAITLHALALLEESQGNLEEAFSLNQKAVGIYTRLKSPDEKQAKQVQARIEKALRPRKTK